MAALRGIGLGMVGTLLALASLVRLGWRRHGAAPTDLSCLHLDWVLRPELPYWRAHLLNLAGLAVGLALLGVGLVLLGRGVVSSRRGRRAPPG